MIYAPNCAQYVAKSTATMARSPSLRPLPPEDDDAVCVGTNTQRPKIRVKPETLKENRKGRKGWVYEQRKRAAWCLSAPLHFMVGADSPARDYLVTP